MRKLGFRPTPRVCLVAATLLASTGCKSPSISVVSIHPDADKQLNFTAGRGNLSGGIDRMKIEVGGTIIADQAGDSATATGGPYLPYSNTRLTARAIANLSGGGTKSKSTWVYVANPKNVFAFTSPSGSNSGYPNSTAEQTGANLYRLDKAVVRTHAINAVMEYANAKGLTVFEVQNVADNLVAAVAWYVDEHMTWRSDTVNRTVFAANGWASYSPGWDFPQPADLTLTISGNLTNASPNDDFQGDCEDHAILRAALLRALGFAPWAIWDAIDNPVTHEYNVVLYEGAFRLMDYGEIDRWLTSHTWNSHRSHYGWNEDNGPRGVNATTHAYLQDHTDNYPGGKSDGNPWSFQIYYKVISP